MVAQNPMPGTFDNIDAPVLTGQMEPGTPTTMLRQKIAEAIQVEYERSGEVV